MTVNIDFSSLKPSAIPAAQASSIQSQIDSWLSNADSAYLSGDYQTAISLWVKITEHRHSETDQIATVHSKLASLYWHLGKTTKALKHWKSSLKIYRKINNDDSPEKIAAVLVDTARTYNDLNRPRFSIPLLTEAISLSRGNKALAKITSMAYLALGNAYMLEADYDLAIDAYQSSIENIPPTESELLIVIWSNLSKVYQQKSLITRQRAIAEAENEDTLANELWQRVADYQNKAWQAVNKAVQSGENSQSIAQVEALLQKVSLAKDGVTKSYDAENNLLQAQRILAALPDSPQKVYALLELNELIGNNTSKSELILNSAIATAQAINLPHVISFAFGAMGKHYESQKQYEDALFWTKRAQSQAQQVQALDILYQWDWQAARIYSATNNGAQATRYYERAITSLQSIRVNSTQTPGAPSFGFQQDIEPIARGFIKLLLSDDFSSYNLQQVLEIKDLLLLNELEDFFKDDCFEIITVNKADQLAYLNKTKTAVVHTIILDDQTHIIWQLPNGEFRKKSVNITQSELEQLLDQWRYDLENKENDNYLTLSKEVYQLIFTSELESYLSKYNLKNIIFVSDGVLRNVPMAALHDGNKFLIESYTISNSLGLNIQTKATKPKIKRALSFGITAGINQFPPLPYVNQEIEQLGKIINEKTFVNSQFTKERFRQEIESSETSLIHVATHGRFAGTTQNSFLQAYKSQINLTELEDILSTHNINFPQSPILLLVLSACDTATGNPRATLGMSGVSARSGVNNTLGSLWSVNDKQIVTLIDSFYQNWINSKMSLPEALRQAQLNLINSHDYHPSNWSSMILLQR